jgi:hypothetical protein
MVGEGIKTKLDGPDTVETATGDRSHDPTHLLKPLATAG